MKRTSHEILALLADCKPRSHKEIIEATGLPKKAVEGSLYRLWRSGLILRTEKPLIEAERIFKGRGEVTRNLRKYYLYMLKSEDKDEVLFQGLRFVKFKEEKEEKKLSKAKIILEFLSKNKDKAFFSKDIAEALKDEGI